MTVLELDTASLTGPDRFGVWVETIGRAFGPFGICRSDPERFHGRVRVERRQDIRFVELGYDGQAFRRSRQDVARLDDAYCSLLRPQRGRLLLTQGGREHVLEPGHCYLVNNAVPYETTPQGAYQTLGLAFPPEALTARVPRPLPFYALADDPASPRFRLLDSFLTQYTEGSASWTDREFAALTNQLLDLIVLTLVDGQSHGPASESAARAGHRARALQHIRAHLGERDLTPTKVAESCGISLAYLQEIFQGRGVEETIFAERLERARDWLRSRPNEAIATLAWRLGFADPAHFSRAFRRRFGVSPREWRSREGLPV
jgi:AraC-like DNA-binding protein